VGYIINQKSEEDQSISICRGTDVIIGTPGRILDCIAKRILVLNQADYVILDEV
jgi:ATP-dependent RNA helicase DDX23/PRP28